jgi:hypothetical protein
MMDDELSIAAKREKDKKSKNRQIGFPLHSGRLVDQWMG